jgi:hypothetical protein
MKMKTLLLSEREAVALKAAIEMYIRVGLGQLAEIAVALERLTERRETPKLDETRSLLAECERTLYKSKEWLLQDPETSSLTIAAFGVQAKLDDNVAAWEWTSKRLHETQNDDPVT